MEKELDLVPNQVIEGKGKRYHVMRRIGRGSFGVVVYAIAEGEREGVAVKRVFQNPKFINRELQIMKSLSHVNCVRLLDFFHERLGNNMYLNLVMEYVPETISSLCQEYNHANIPFPIVLAKLYTFQLARALGYLHSFGICHRDVKPQNLLVNRETGILKLCDFGSAKMLQAQEENISYICSRFYRAPELIFSARIYTVSIDVWSLGCVLAEMVLGYPIFQGNHAVDVLVRIMKVLGTPTQDDIHQMNPKYSGTNLPIIKPTSLQEIFDFMNDKDIVHLLSSIFQYNPTKRPSAISLTGHPFFKLLRNPETVMANGNPLPSLVPTTTAEMEIENSLN